MDILLLGDSIRIGYQQEVKEYFENVYYPVENGRYSTQFLYYIPHWKYELQKKSL